MSVITPVSTSEGTPLVDFGELEKGENHMEVRPLREVKSHRSSRCCCVFSWISCVFFVIALFVAVVFIARAWSR